MNNEYLISIVVPVYNVEDYLPRCVDSLLRQTHQNLEIILVNDGSKDGSGRICDAYAQKDSRIRVIHKENGGASTARNAALDVARGEYIGFADSDDWVEPDAYEQMLAQCLENNTQVVCTGRFDVKDTEASCRKGLCPTKNETITGVQLLGRMFTWDNCDFALWDKLFHRTVLQDIRFPVNKIGEDIVFLFNVLRNVPRASMLDKPLYYYFLRPNSVTRSSFSEKTMHFAEHTALIYPQVKEHHPEIEKQARYFRVRSILYTLGELNRADETARKKYKQAHQAFRQELWKYMPFVLTSPYFSNAERVRGLLLASGMYGFVRKVYKTVK